jgi:hypothetical protein
MAAGLYATCWHLTPAKNLPSILEQGLLPHQNEDMGDEPGVYLFPHWDDAENALLNWFGERFEDEPLVALEVGTKGLDLAFDPEVGYEVMSRSTIPPAAILGIWDEEAGNGTFHAEISNTGEPHVVIVVDLDPKTDPCGHKLRIYGSPDTYPTLLAAYEAACLFQAQAESIDLGEWVAIFGK